MQFIYYLRPEILCNCVALARCGCGAKAGQEKGAWQGSEDLTCGYEVTFHFHKWVLSENAEQSQSTPCQGYNLLV